MTTCRDDGGFEVSLLCLQSEGAARERRTSKAWSSTLTTLASRTTGPYLSVRSWISRQRKRWADCSWASLAPSFFMLQFCAVLATVSRSMANLLSAAAGSQDGLGERPGWAARAGKVSSLTALLEARGQLPVHDDIGVAATKESREVSRARELDPSSSSTHRIGLVWGVQVGRGRVSLGASSG